MIRKTLTILSLIGLLLSVGLWGVSYVRIDVLLGSWQRNLISLDDGVLFVGQVPSKSIFSTPWLFRFMETGGYYYGVAIPLWIPVIAFGIGSLLSYLPLHHRRKRKKLGLCIVCGYDLRGSKERCPECNTPFESHA